MSDGGGSTRRVDVGGHALRVRTLGDGEPVFVCLHGLVDSLEIWSELAPGLAERGRVVLVDQRAHGDSDAPPGPYSREALAADVIALCDRLGIHRAVLIGHSMGGIVAMTAALAYPEPVSGLVLLGTASECTEKVARWYERIALAGEQEGEAGLVRAIYGERSRKRIAGDAVGIAAVTRTLKSLYSDPLTPKLGALGCPALLVVGEKDPMGAKASEILRDSLPDAELEWLPGLGHWTHVEAPERVLAALDRWLASNHPTLVKEGK